MKNLIAQIILFVLPVFSILYAVDKPMVSTGDLLFYLDNASFKGKDNKTYFELYLMVYADQLAFKDSTFKKIGELSINVCLKDSNGTLISEKQWVTEAVFDSIKDIRTLVVYDYWGELLNPGNYKILLKVSDRIKNISGFIESNIYVPLINTGSIGLSDILFANGINKNIDPDMHNKSVILNPSRRYGFLNPTLYFYYEIYNPNYVKNLYADYTIQNISGKIIKRIQSVDISNESQSFALTQAIDVSKLSSGVYSFTINVQNQSGEITKAVSRNFEIIQLDYLTQKPALSEEDSEMIERILVYLATPSQLKIYRSLDRSARTYFVLRFFKDSDPNSDDKSSLTEAVERYNYANDQFGWGNIEGWATERGRVVIQNGKPDDIEYHSFDTDSKPYEIWIYRNMREYSFIFADLISNGNYILLHSNKEGEVYNTNWLEYVKGF